MDFLEKDERDYVSVVKSIEDQIKLLFARAFNQKLQRDVIPESQKLKIE